MGEVKAAARHHHLRGSSRLGQRRASILVDNRTREGMQSTQKPHKQSPAAKHPDGAGPQKRNVTRYTAAPSSGATAHANTMRTKDLSITTLPRMYANARPIGLPVQLGFLGLFPSRLWPSNSIAQNRLYCI